MIHDQVRNANLYTAQQDRIAIALQFLQTTDFSQLADGRHEIDDNRVYAVIMSYQTRLPEEANPEAHDRYIDIQSMIVGEEQFHLGFRDDMTELVEARPNDDIAFYRGPTRPLILRQSEFLILYPHDVHAPGLCVGEPKHVRKVVVKVLVE